MLGRSFGSGTAALAWLTTLVSSCYQIQGFQLIRSMIDQLEPPARDINGSLRIPISNVFKGQGSGTWVAGRLCAGVVQVGDRLRVLPGDETAVVRGKCDILFLTLIY